MAQPCCRQPARQKRHKRRLPLPTPLCSHISMPRRAAAVLLLPLLLAAQDPVFRANVSLVRVDAEVRINDTVIDGLHPEDFLVTDNGQPQRIVAFSHDDEPLDLILLFDISESMAPSIRKVVTTSKLAFNELRPGDRVAAMSFNTQVRLEEPFTEDLKGLQARLAERIANTNFAGGTYILDAISRAANYFLAQTSQHHRRAILVFTDNAGHGVSNEKAVIRKLWDADAVVAGLILPGEDQLIHVMGPHLSSSDSVIEPAAQTGGDVVDASPPGPAFYEAIDRLRRRYSIFYQAPPGKVGELHKVTVELQPSAKKRNPGAKVLARKGYILEKQPQ